MITARNITIQYLSANVQYNQEVFNSEIFPKRNPGKSHI